MISTDIGLHISCYLIQYGLLDIKYTELSHVELIICMAAHPFMFLLHEQHKKSPIRTFEFFKRINL